MASERSGTSPELYKLSMSAAATDINQQAMESDNLDDLINKVNNGEIGLAFDLSQILFAQKRYDEASKFLQLCPANDHRAKFLIATMLFDGLGGFELSNDNQLKAVTLMSEIGQLPLRNDPFVYTACYNVGCAHFLSIGVLYTSPEDAEMWWVRGADDGNPLASVRAQTALGMFYSRPGNADLEKAFFWHSLAVGNGSVESQAAIGVMYDRGLGTRRNEEDAFDCLRDAAARGSCFAIGYLSSIYYRRRLYVKCVELAVKCLETYGSCNFDDPIWQQEAPLSASTTAKRGLSVAAFYLARCLQLGKGVRSDEGRSKYYLKLSIKHDADMAAQLMVEAQTGKI